jgi:hypothetical protein
MVIVFVAVNRPPVPIVGHMLWAVHTVELEPFVFEDTGFEHRKGCLRWRESHVVVSLQKGISTESLKVLDVSWPFCKSINQHLLSD